MTVHSLALEDFRNYVHLNADFDPKLNVILGENAQGKTVVGSQRAEHRAFGGEVLVGRDKESCP